MIEWAGVLLGFGLGAAVWLAGVWLGIRIERRRS